MWLETPLYNDLINLDYVEYIRLDNASEGETAQLYAQMINGEKCKIVDDVCFYSEKSLEWARKYALHEVMNEYRKAIKEIMQHMTSRGDIITFDDITDKVKEKYFANEGYRIAVNEPLGNNKQDKHLAGYHGTGDRLYLVRSLYQISQREMASRSGISLSIISKAEQNLYAPNAKILTKISNALGINNIWLISGQGDIFSSKITCLLLNSSYMPRGDRKKSLHTDVYTRSMMLYMVVAKKASNICLLNDPEGPGNFFICRNKKGGFVIINTDEVFREVMRELLESTRGIRIDYNSQRKNNNIKQLAKGIDEFCLGHINPDIIKSFAGVISRYIDGCRTSGIKVSKALEDLGEQFNGNIGAHDIFSAKNISVLSH